MYGAFLDLPSFKKDSQGHQDGATAIYFDWLCVRNGADRYFSQPVRIGIVEVLFTFLYVWLRILGF